MTRFTPADRREWLDSARELSSLKRSARSRRRALIALRMIERGRPIEGPGGVAARLHVRPSTIRRAIAKLDGDPHGR